MTIVALPAPTPYAGFPELYAAFTMAEPPVAIVRSQTAISSWARGMLGFSRHWMASAGPPALHTAARRTRVVASAVLRLIGCGEKTTASRHFSALIAMPTIVTKGLVTGRMP